MGCLILCWILSTRVQILGAKHFLFYFNFQRKISNLSRCLEICHIIDCLYWNQCPAIHLFDWQTMNKISKDDKASNNSNQKFFTITSHLYYVTLHGICCHTVLSYLFVCFYFLGYFWFTQCLSCSHINNVTDHKQ